MGALALLSVGCAPRTGWVRIERVCQASDPPRVCFVAEPDAPLTLEVGGMTLVPGECAQAPKTKTKRASLKVAVVDGRSGEVVRKRVGAGRGRTASITATQGDGLEIDVSHGRCGD